jgi:hypothetical protein
MPHNAAQERKPPALFIIHRPYFYSLSASAQLDSLRRLCAAKTLNCLVREKMDLKRYEATLDSIDSPIVFVDNGHIIRYLNKVAYIRYERRGFSNLVGKSLFDCHNPESKEYIKRIHERLFAGETTIFLKVNKDQEKITVVGVRDADGQLVGYYERFEKATEPTVGGNGKPAPQP